MPALSGSQKALMFARAGLARSGATRSGYYNSTMPVTVGGVDKTAYVWKQTCVVEKTAGAQANTARVLFFNYTPVAGQLIVIGDGSISNPLFGGSIVRVNQPSVRKAALVLNWAECQDWTYLLKKRKVYGRFTSQAMHLIFLSLAASYAAADGFTVNNVMTGSPTIDAIEFTGEDLPVAFTRLVNRVNWKWYPHANKDLHAFDTETTQAPTPITVANLVYENLDYSEDANQVITRVIAVGGGGKNTAPVDPGAALIPVDECSWYDPGFYVDTVLADGASPLWRFDVVAGNVPDASGDGNHLVVSSYVGIGTHVAGAVHDATYGFSTTLAVSAATFTTGILLAGAYAIEFWITPTNQGAVYQSVIIEPSTGVGIYINPDMTLAMYAANQVYSVTPLVAGQTYHVVYLTNGAVGKWYINGVDDTVGPGTFPSPANNITVTALFADAFAEPLAATLIDEVAFYLSALTADQIADHYARGSAPAGELEAGPQRVRYGARSATSGPGNLVGVPTSGDGAVLYRLPQGTNVNVLVQTDDETAQAALAAIEGGDGIHERRVQDGRWSEAEAGQVGTSLLNDWAERIAGATYETTDFFTDIGKNVDVTLPARGIAISVPIQKVTIRREGFRRWKRAATLSGAVRLELIDAIRAQQGGTQ